MFKIISWAAVILWMGFIFYLSHQPAQVSNELSTGITELVVKTIEKVAPDKKFDIQSFNHIIRKNAHFFAYLVLGIFILNALRRSGVLGYRSVIITLVTCILYAISDEVHQIFIPGRGPGLKDVLIDSAGSSVGMVIYLLFGKLFY